MSKRVVFIRSGGLGDFLLTLPALSGALAFYEETILFTRSSYHSLLSDYSDSLTLKERGFGFGYLARRAFPAPM